MAHSIRITSADRHAGANTPAVRARSLHTTLSPGSRRKLRRFIAARDKARERDHASGARFGASR